MFAQITFFPEQASTTARYVDQFFYFLVIVCGAVGLLVAVLLISWLRILVTLLMRRSWTSTYLSSLSGELPSLSQLMRTHRISIRLTL